MSRSLRRLLLLGALLVACPAVSAQTTLFEFTSGQVGEASGRVDTVSFPINFLNRFDTSLFEQLSFTQADVGRTVTATRDTDPKFDAFTALLTDGAKGQIAFNFYPAPEVNKSGLLYAEPQVVWSDANDPRIDLHGQTVGAYSLRIDMLTIYPPSRGGFNAQVTFSAIAAPEPAGALSFAFLGSAVMAMRKRR